MASQYTSLTYPVFEPGQALKSKDLNALVDYLETHDRLTRAYLIGSGIFYGLKWTLETVNGFNLCIEKGAGVSSEGHLFALKLEKDIDDNEVPCCLNAIASVTMNYTAFNSYLQDDDLPDFGLPGGPKRSFNLFELVAGDPTVPTSVPTGFSFSKNDILKAYCLIMYWDIQPKDRKSCIDSCDGTGSDMDFKMRFFMISETDLKVIWLNMTPASSSGGNFSQLFPFLTRLHKAQALDTMEQPGHLYDAWKKVVKDAIGTASVPGNIPTAVVGALNGQSSAPTATQLQAQLMAVFNALTAGPPTHEPELQYFNDYLCDLVATVNEIAALSTQSVLTLCPDESLFPTFISLGNINNQVNATAKCRMPFYRLPLEGASDSSADKLAFLQEKLLCLIKGNEPMLPIVPEIPTPKMVVRISGSDFKSLPLSEQAIPFYYKDIAGLRDKWNFELTRAGRQAFIQSYEDNDATKTYPRNILCYDLKGEMFFRIEGHLDMALSTGVTAIENLRKDLNLPFKLVLLRLSPKLNISYSGTDPNVLEILNYMQFSEFAKDHPGMEHMAGVPTGGTFIVVFKEEVNQDFQKALESPDTTPQTIELLIRNVKRTIIADFCLPYGCYSGPNVQYIFEEEVVGNQSCRAEADFEERQINDLEYVFENRSPLADEFTWEVFRAIDGIATGAAIATQAYVKTDPNPLANFEFEFPYYGEFLVQLTAICKEDHLTDTAQRVVKICPEEDVLITYTDLNDNVFMALSLVQGDDNDYTLTAVPPGGVWDYKGLKLAGLANPSVETEDTLTLNFSGVDTQGTAQTFLIKYVFPCDGKEAQFPVTIEPEQNVVFRAAAPANPTPLSLQIGYQQEANNIADSSLKSLSAFKKAMNYLQTPPPETDAVYGKFDETVAKLLTSLANPGMHDPEDFRLLLRNVVYLFLDRIMIDTRPDAVKTALDTLTAAADKLSAQGINLNTWHGNTLPSTNPKTLKTITNLL